MILLKLRAYVYIDFVIDHKTNSLKTLVRPVILSCHCRTSDKIEDMVQASTPSNPPPLTRSSMKKASFDRVVTDVIGIIDDDLLLKALDDSVSDLLTLMDNQIDMLSFDDSAGSKVPPLSSRNKLRVLRSCV